MMVGFAFIWLFFRTVKESNLMGIWSFYWIEMLI